MSKIGWRFPPTNGGESDGYNHPGIGHFRGAPFESLARETIQNSLDAVSNSKKPVDVVFELIDVSSDELGGSELAETISACLNAVRDDDDPARPALQKAERIVKDKKIPCLRISDRNTTGLRGRHWRTLVKIRGQSYKQESSNAGGSHGIGKYAPFAVSDLRTVFYWSCFEKNDKLVEKFQGKSILTRHQKNEEEMQGTGFFGVKQHCAEMDDSIPDKFRVFDSVAGKPVEGTSVTVIGFRANAGEWRRKIADSVLASFFYAIDDNKLRITLEPDEYHENGEIDICRDTLDEWFRIRLVDSNIDGGKGDYSTSEDIDSSGLKNASIYRDIVKTEDPVETQDKDLGHCRLWIRVSDKEVLPRSVALVRRTGMLITDQQKKLQRFPGYRNFAALCVFEDPKGNNLLRRMENEKHDQFEPHRLPEDEHEQGRKALERIVKWIRDEVRKVAGPSKEGRKMALDELASYLPLLGDEGDVFDRGTEGDIDGREHGLGERITVTLKPVRRSAPPTLPPVSPEEGGVEGNGTDIGYEGGGGTGGDIGGYGYGGAGEGNGAGGTGGQGGGVKQRSVSVSGVRILPIRDRENCYRLSFAADFDGVVSLTLDEAGDSTAIPRSDVKAMDSSSPLQRVRVVRGKRNTICITAEQPVTDRAWRLSAVAASES